MEIDSPICSNCGKEAPCDCENMRVKAEWCVPIHEWNKLVKEKIHIASELSKFQGSIQTCKNGHTYFADSHEYLCPVCKYQEALEFIKTLIYLDPEKAISDWKEKK